MRAAVVEEFGSPPRWTEVPDPVATGRHEAVVDVVAVGLHPRVRSQAAGSHYTSTDELPLIPGIDGVGRDAEGRLRYFVLRDTVHGSVAQRAVIDVRHSVLLPPGADPAQVAAVMNPAMSSWIALRQRVGLRAGQSVLVLGATGNAGAMAVRVARRLGAGRVIAVGRGAQRMAAADPDAIVALDDAPDRVAEQLGRAASDVDVVLDYLWGRPTADALRAIVPARHDDDQKLTWVQIGSVAGTESPIPSAALRATRLDIAGSGQGSVPATRIVAELGELLDEVAAGHFTSDVLTMPLSQVGQAWLTGTHGTQRVVLVA
ncbi:quinone oxidoreductase family protein [Propionibacterium freudenreichii]|uniref:quinone oxidoreductase family protein n=1 Tax=Propionibacterium freudenreichii TaxID=1744 RepID=UPI000BC2EFBD|nr:zinc-binding alcohol dehydrogenase family protein [Propionibacterium freudenreichii]MDK9593102.1 zinc-binding alcohol dehydrogenase family protein [Propionibacterium freudenreichii]WFF34115.1 zinc-binding alcohol dehydrogenase family protein [Propionibacterium freudenreichii]WFF36346.1 zinc-binding alcohol dehydrogenase family protein [Propionibacterium freudenreichii]SBN51790.1 Zinc-containing alcohol dehydrogenase (ADH) [Propionibacterium freudenreichii]